MIDVSNLPGSALHTASGRCILMSCRTLNPCCVCTPFPDAPSPATQVEQKLSMLMLPPLSRMLCVPLAFILLFGHDFGVPPTSLAPVLDSQGWQHLPLCRCLLPLLQASVAPHKQDRCS